AAAGGGRRAAVRRPWGRRGFGAAVGTGRGRVEVSCDACGPHRPRGSGPFPGVTEPVPAPPTTEDRDRLVGCILDRTAVRQRVPTSRPWACHAQTTDGRGKSPSGQLLVGSSTVP